MLAKVVANVVAKGVVLSCSDTIDLMGNGSPRPCRERYLLAPSRTSEWNISLDLGKGVGDTRLEVNKEEPFGNIKKIVHESPL